MAKSSKKAEKPPIPAVVDADTGKALPYEVAYARLESVLAQLEGGDLPLEESLALYEEGSRLGEYCAALLDTAELRVRQWQPGDEPTAFDEWADESGE